MSVGAVFFWVFVLAASAVGGVVALMALRRRLLGPRSEAGGEMFTLEQVRAMRAAGRIDEREYQALRAAAVAQWGAGGEPMVDSQNRTTTTGVHQNENRLEREDADRKQTSADDGQTRRAKPGFDLTGAPLPPRTEPPA